MVNDTTTLNGALSELGETMADNLFSMGVIDADASDGLTTLANKILNIEPSISGLDLDTSLTIHSSETSCLIGQSIMFWAELKADYDDETATDVDLSGVLTGATVTFKYGNTVLGTGVTDADGIAYYTHTFTTGGTYNITASFAGTENFDDCVSSSITVSVTYEMTITADKPILSFADSDVATITATLSDGVAGVGGETLSYEVLDKDDNVLDSGSDVTDASGEISFSYQSLGIGDVQVVVYYGIFLQETYEVEDCHFYGDMAKIKSSWTSDTSVSGHTGYAFDTTFTDDVEVSFKFKNSLPSRWLIGFAPAWVTYKAIYSQEANFWIYWTPTNASSSTYERYNASKTVNSVFKLTTEDLHKITYTVDDVGAVTKETNSNMPLKLMVRENNSYPITFDYMKIKAL